MITQLCYDKISTMLQYKHSKKLFDISLIHLYMSSVEQSSGLFQNVLNHVFKLKSLAQSFDELTTGKQLI